MRESAIPIPGYRIDACISAGSASTLYRARRELDRTSVVLMTSREEVPAGEIGAGMARVLDALSPVIAALSDLDCPATDAGDGNRDGDGEPDPDALRTLLVKLRGLLEDADSEATEVAEELEPLLRNSIQGQSLGRLVDQIASFDFEAALETLQDIEERQV